MSEEVKKGEVFLKTEQYLTDIARAEEYTRDGRYLRAAGKGYQAVESINQAAETKLVEDLRAGNFKRAAGDLAIRVTTGVLYPLLGPAYTVAVGLQARRDQIQ